MLRNWNLFNWRRYIAIALIAQALCISIVYCVRSARMSDEKGSVGRAKLLNPRGSRAGRGFCRPLPYHLGTAPAPP